MQMNYKIAGQFEHLYPITLGDNVKLNSGKTLEEWKQEVNDLLNAVEDGYTEIWSGSDPLGKIGSGITLPSTLSSAKNGWILVFEPADSTSNKNYCYIPKVHPDGSSGVKFIVGGKGGVIYSKFVVINGTALTGHTINIENGNETMTLKQVIKY